jgi:hypothetical protein
MFPEVCQIFPELWLLLVAVGSVVEAGAAIGPLILFQMYGFRMFCVEGGWGTRPRPWCGAKVPYIYGKGTFGEHQGGIQGIFREGNIQGTFKEHSRNMQGTFREHSGNIQGIFRGHSGNLQGIFGEGNIKGTFKEHSGNI